MVVIQETEWAKLMDGQIGIIRLLKELNVQAPIPSVGITFPYISSIEFMKVVWIGRKKFDQLVQTNRVKTIKKDRETYVPTGAGERYFSCKF